MSNYYSGYYPPPGYGPAPNDQPPPGSPPPGANPGAPPPGTPGVPNRTGRFVTGLVVGVAAAYFLSNE
ncbi:MAG: hypothetical protein ACFCBW_04165 [Candidatus Competibacterales bacterium]